MDNDVQGTEYCIGFSTAITRAKEAINRQRTTLGSHERIGVFRIFGRDAGFSALYTAYVTSARCVIPEVPYDLDALAALLKADHAANPSHYAFVITAEGAIWKGAQMTDVGSADAFGHRHKANVGEALALELRERTGIETLASELTYDLRSGEPDSLDALVATTFANIAMDLIELGVTGQMMAIQDGKYAHTALPDPALGPRRMDVAGPLQRRTVPSAIQRQTRSPDAVGRPRLSTPHEVVSRAEAATSNSRRGRSSTPAVSSAVTLPLPVHRGNGRNTASVRHALARMGPDRCSRNGPFVVGLVLAIDTRDDARSLDPALYSVRSVLT